MKRGILWTFLTLVLLVGGLYLLRGPIVTLACRQVLLPYLPKAQISLRDFKWKSGKCILKDFVITSKEREWVRVEHVECDLNVQLSPLRIRPKIALDGVEIQAVSSNGGPNSLENVRKTLAKQQVVDLVIARGIVHFDENVPDMTFAFEPSCLKGHLGTIRLDNESILIDLFAKGKDVYTKLFLSNSNMAHLSQVIQFFNPDWRFEVYEGALSGSFELGIHRKKVLDHLRFSLRAHQFRGKGFSAEEFSIGMHLPFDGVGETKVRDLTPTAFFSRFVTMAEVKKGELCFTNQATGKNWKIDRFDGMLDGREKKFPTFRGAGVVLYEGVGLPLEVSARAELGKDAYCSFDLDFLHRNEGGKASFGATLGGRSKKFSCEINELTGLELAMVQDVARIFTDVSLQINSGNISGKVEGIYEAGRMLAVDVRHFDARGISGQYLDNSFAIEQVRGKGIYHLSHPVILDAIVRGASFQTPVGEMACLTGSFKADNGAIYDTSIWGEWEGIDFDAHIGGFFHELNVRTNFSFGKTCAYLEHWKKAKLVYPELQPISECVSNVTFRDLDTGWQAEGNLQTNYEESPSDIMHFRLIAAGDSALEIFQKKEVSGAFWGNNISHQLFAIPLGIFQEMWQLRGNIDIQGEFDESGLELDIQPNALSFSSPDLDIDLKEIEKAVRLHWDFARAQWRGNFHVNQATALQKPLSLAFSNVSGTVDISGLVLEARNISASCEGVDLGGYITCEFSQSGLEDLQISIDDIEGSAKEVQVLLRHFDEMKELDIPIEGTVLSCGSSWISVQKDDLECAFYTRVVNGELQLAEGLQAFDLSFQLEWSSRTKLLEMKDFEGKLSPTTGGDDLYSLSAKYLRCLDVENLVWEYDIRAATSTYDILRLVGKGKREDDLFACTIDSEYSHFYRGKLDVETMLFNLDFTPHSIAFHSEMGVANFAFALQFLANSGVIPIKENMVEEFQSDSLGGNITVDVCANNQTGNFACELTGIDVPFRFSFDKRDKEVQVKEFHMGELKGNAFFQEAENSWEIKKLSVEYGLSHVTFENGTFDPSSGAIHLPIENMSLDLSELKDFFLEEEIPYLCRLNGMANIEGDVELDISEGWKEWKIQSALSLSCDAFGPGKTIVKSRVPFLFEFGAHKKCTVSQAKFKYAEDQDEEMWSEIDVEILEIEQGRLSGTGVKVVLPPEMALHLAQHGFFPNLNVEDGALNIGGIPLVWENQLASEFEFTYTGGIFKAHGVLQEGYYWIGQRSWFLKDFAFNFYGDRLRLTSQVKLHDFVFDISSVISFGSDISGQVSISENVTREDLRPLAVFFRWNPSQGVVIQGAEGSLYGLSFDLHHNPRVYLPKQMILTGSVGVDSVALLELFPEELKHQIKKLGIGKGYELSGDIILALDNLSDVRFRGYLKGRDFVLFDWQLKTLLSEIEICKTQVVMRNFRLSDEGGVCLAKEIRIVNKNDDWEAIIPEVVLQDFRPSLIKRFGQQRGNLRPFVVKNLHFCNIEGSLSDPESFKGRGYLHFYNTFKRDFHLLDIPFDIIGRLGLDLNLFIPVKGRVDFNMADGKIFLTSLTESYSDGERSKFYFPENKEIYIGLDGTLYIDLKMKQYVLLKITEPFTVSVRGTLMKPRYSLK